MTRKGRGDKGKGLGRGHGRGQPPPERSSSSSSSKEEGQKDEGQKDDRQKDEGKNTVKQVSTVVIEVHAPYDSRKATALTLLEKLSCTPTAQRLRNMYHE